MTSNFGTLRLSTPTGPLLAAKLALFETAINIEALLKAQNRLFDLEHRE